MIDVIPPEEERYEPFEGLEEVLQQKEQMRIIERVAIDEDISKELHELNKTLKEILREMRKRK